MYDSFGVYPHGKEFTPVIKMCIDISKILLSVKADLTRRTTVRKFSSRYVVGPQTKPGTYRILNTVTGKFYAGSSKNVKGRLNIHASNLIRGNHGNSHLQNSWNKYSADAFVFQVIEYCDESQCLKLEQEILDEYFKQGLLYNVCDKAARVSDTGIYGKKHKGYKHTAESRRKMSAALKGRQIDPDWRKKISDAQKGIARPQWSGVNSATFGKKMSQESRNKMRLGHLGKKFPKWRCEAISKRVRGSKLSPEACLKVSAGKKGKKAHPYGTASAKFGKVASNKRTPMARLVEYAAKKAIWSLYRYVPARVLTSSMRY